MAVEYVFSPHISPFNAFKFIYLVSPSHFPSLDFNQDCAGYGADFPYTCLHLPIAG